MKKEINLEEILNSIVENTNPHGDRVFFKEDILKAMKESCSQCLDLAAENAWYEYEDLETGEIFDYTDVMTDDMVGVNIDKDSILQIKDWIK